MGQQRQQQRAPSPEKAASRKLWEDFDIRKHQPAQPGSREQAVIGRRKAALEAWRASSGTRVSWDERGLVKSMSRDGAALTPPFQGDPVEAAKDFLRSHGQVFAFAEREVEALLLERRLSSEGMTSLLFRQTWNGMPVFGGEVKITLNADGQVVHAGMGDVIPQLSLPSSTRISPEEAIRAAYRSLRLEEPAELAPLAADAGGRASFRNPGGERLTPITAETVVFPMGATSATLAWRLLIETAGDWYEILVEAETGRLLWRHSLKREASGRVWRESPLRGARELVTFPPAWLPLGVAITTGNNADVYLDADGDNVPDATFALELQSGRALSTTQVFDFPAPETPGLDPRTFRAASITNAFYFVNTAHDFFYNLGFTEAAGNFQTNNFGMGGVGNDAVRVEVQDARDVDNASFFTPPDGGAPRMQLGLFRRGTPATTDDLDTAYDGHIVVHEYSHGVTQRMVGGPNATNCLFGTQSGAMAEGWSDYFAISFFNNPITGAYSTQDLVRGIRRQSYEGYRFTYEDIGNNGYEFHNDGEIWAATLWDLRRTLAQGLADRLVVQALKLTTCVASMLDARDAILSADLALTRGANRPAIWTVFARHGMGHSASGFDAAIYNAAFDRPPDLQPGNRNPMVLSTPPLALVGARFFYQVVATDPDGGVLRYELTQGPTGMTIDVASGLLQWNPIFLAERVKVTITDGQGGRIIHGFQVFVETPLTPGRAVTITAPAESAGFASINVPAGTLVLQVTLRRGTGDPDILLIDPVGNFYGITDRIGPTETISAAAPRPGRWLAVVLAFTAYASVEFMADLPTPTLVTGSTTLAGLSGEVSTELFYRVVVPPGAGSMTISTTNPRDTDLFVSYNRVPVCQLFDIFLSTWCQFQLASARIATGNETVSVGTPSPGDWFFTISAGEPFTGLTLSVNLQAPATLAAIPGPALTFNVIEGGTPSPQALTIFNTAGAPFTWNATPLTSSGGNWLRLSQSSGAARADVNVIVVTTGLAFGTYRGTITISSPELVGSPITIPVTLNYTARPALAVNATTLNFSTIPGQTPAPQVVQITNTGGGDLNWTAEPSTTTGGAWLALDPTRGTGNSALRVSIRVAGLGEGTYEGVITVSAAGAGGSPRVVRVTLAVGRPVTLTAAGVRNVGTLAEGFPIAGGLVVTLYGDGFSEACSVDLTQPNPCPRSTVFPLSTQLGTTRVTINGRLAPLLLVTQTQINLIAPFGLTGTNAIIVVTRGPISSAPVVVPLSEQAIGLLTVVGTGGGAGLVFKGGGQLVTREAPLVPEEIVAIYGVGFGPVSPEVSADQPAPGNPLAMTTIPMRIFFDGSEGEILFSGLSPGSIAGLYQLVVRVPPFLARRYPVVIVQSNISSSNEVSAGGPSLLDISPATARAAADVTVRIRGFFLPPISRVRIGNVTMSTVFSDGPIQTLTVTIPASAIPTAGEVEITVFDPANPIEAPSNAVRLRLQ